MAKTIALENELLLELANVCNTLACLNVRNVNRSGMVEIDPGTADTLQEKGDRLFNAIQEAINEKIKSA